jgi:hypothetical protein
MIQQSRVVDEKVIVNWNFSPLFISLVCLQHVAVFLIFRSTETIKKRTIGKQFFLQLVLVLMGNFFQPMSNLCFRKKLAQWRTTKFFRFLKANWRSRAAKLAELAIVLGFMVYWLN